MLGGRKGGGRGRPVWGGRGGEFGGEDVGEDQAAVVPDAVVFGVLREEGGGEDQGFGGVVILLALLGRQLLALVSIGRHVYLFADLRDQLVVFVYPLQFPLLLGFRELAAGGAGDAMLGKLLASCAT